MEKQELLTTTEVAKWLKIAESTLRKWVHYGFIPHVKVGRCMRFLREDIEQWLREKAEKGRSTLAPEIQWQQ